MITALIKIKIYSLFLIIPLLNCTSLNHNTKHHNKVITTIELQQLIQSGRYCNRNIDVNGDGIIDVILFNKPFVSLDSLGCKNENFKYFGDTMYFFTKLKNDTYQLVFSGYNFSEDGGFQTQDIIPTNDSNCLFYIYTRYPQGDFTAKHFVKFTQNNWILEFTEYQFFDKKNNSDFLIKYTCKVEQNINLSKLGNDTPITSFNYIPDEAVRDRVCDTITIPIK